MAGAPVGYGRSRRLRLVERVRERLVRTGAPDRCSVCGRPVRSDDEAVRLRGRQVHVDCALRRVRRTGPR